MRVPRRLLWLSSTLVLTLLSGGCIGVGSSASKATPSAGNVSVPAQPANLQAVPGNSSVALMWTAPTGASSYTVGRSTTSGSAYTQVGSSTAPAFNDTGLKNGTKYYYVVSAANSAGAGPNSVQVMATPTAPTTTPTTPPTTSPTQTTPPSSSTGGEQAASADAFVDSAGVNVHINDLVTSYGNFALVESALKGLGVRHVRDGLVDTTWTGFYDRMNELGRDGIKAVYTTSVGQSAALIAEYPSRVSDSFEAYEAPNEYDVNGGSNWAPTLDAFMATLHKAVKSSSVSSSFPIYGPSITEQDQAAFPKTATTASDFDYANLHNYFEGRNPGNPGWGTDNYGSYAWNLGLVQKTWGSKPIVSTETGYFNDLTKSSAVPEDVSGKYMPRLLFEQWMHGIQRTYIYELVDLGPKTEFVDATYGMMHADFSPKPAYTALQNMLQLLNDPGPTFSPGNLSFTLSGDLTDVQHLLLEKRDGTFYLAIWVEEPCYDVLAAATLPVATHSVILNTANVATINAHQILDTGQMQNSSLASGRTQTLQVTDRVLILEISQ